MDCEQNEACCLFSYGPPATNSFYRRTFATELMTQNTNFELQLSKTLFPSKIILHFSLIDMYYKNFYKFYILNFIN